MNLQEQFGNIDIYLFDQLLKGRIKPGMAVLDAGCGSGRNLIYMLRAGFDVSGVDRSEASIMHLRSLAHKLAPQLPDDNFRVEAVEELSFPDASFDAVISNAVLHFASDEDYFRAMVNAMWRVLKTGGIFFARLASMIGIEDKVRHLNNRQFYLPDGSQRFLVDIPYLQSIGKELGAFQLEPIKTVNVENLRCMTNWCLQKATT